MFQLSSTGFTARQCWCMNIYFTLHQIILQGIKSLTGHSGVSTTATEKIHLNILNQFFARFDHSNNIYSRATSQFGDANGDTPIQLHPNQVRSALCRIKTRKAPGPDGVTGRILKVCADQLSGVFTTIFNLSLQQSAVPSSFKSATIIPVAKKNPVRCLNDYRPVALTPIVSKCFERLIIPYIRSAIPANLDQYQFAYRSNRSIENAVISALHSALTHLDQKNSCKDVVCWLQSSI